MTSTPNRQKNASASQAATTAPALWQQLEAVAQALHGILGGQSSKAVLAQVPQRLRPGVQALLFQVLRNLGRAQALQKQLVSRSPSPKVSALLSTALALAWDEAHAPYPPFTLVNQAVEVAKRGAARAQSGFINACLRRFLRERDALVAATEHDPVAVWNHPAWWIARLKKDHPQDWQTILAANNAQPPMTLRVNAQKCTPAQYLSRLNAINLKAFSVAETGLQLEHAAPVQELPHFAEGWASVQDAAAQAAAPLLLAGLPQPQGRPLRVLDACAAPGGKTAHLLERAAPGSIEVTALEIDPERASRIGETLSRLGLEAKVLVADAGKPEAWFESQCGGQLFDAILLDAPCTASGIVRRQPDVRWLRRESDVAQLAQIQAKLLDTLWPLLQPGGRMVYCTCSIFKAEGDAQMQAFLARNTEVLSLPAPGHLIPGKSAKDGLLADNPLGDHDGFFYALLEKTR
ncbi:16S rRNA (cytosine(967)-C(5))-methyltransferase RsmB [Comamonas testosteroni]|uniref:16S rRNA (cytosine(967)-C(5))-methyltransferase n=1 Tax=Comamonas testosteroni TaxID=285 RepID=A0A373F6P1_COMTE|nr:16S rRNA (cytosine(967)-C(5))-methyltransferase RsmB [Comamonas testosteroni]RGE39834.1 16S rRNA (cytosine(967)-C(5))-methyltransferase RsmB [Comamonas testosteroni]